MKKQLATLCFLMLAADAAIADRTAGEAAIRSLRDAVPGAATIVTSPVTGSITFFAVESGRGVAVDSADSAGDEERALRFVELYGAAFGFASPNEVRTLKSSHDELGQIHVRLQQTHLGVPVAGAELLVHLRDGRVVAANGRTSAGLEGLDVTPLVDAQAARAKAEEAVAARSGEDDLQISEPRLEILDRGLFEGRSTPARPSWFIEATRLDVREFIWVDAKSGLVNLRFSQLTDALNRSIYDGNSAAALPGTLVRSEGGPATGDPDEDLAYTFGGHTYTYFFTTHGRDSYNGAGAALVSTTDHCPSPGSCPLANAFWNGTQMVYGNGYSSADDVVGHELTHAVTEYSAGLFYYMQSGALNESFSDIFGESVDLGNGAGNDTPGVRWQLGEDLPIGAIRNMANPGVFGDPARVLDPNFYCGGEDNGGVHLNSGVPNKAYTLMVDGGTFNGYTITALGRTKSDKIQYRALTTYLLSASDFLDDYNALYRSCMDLIGTAGITGANCLEVRDALDAVQMNVTLPCLPTPAAVPSFCPVGQAPSVAGLADFEAPIGFPACPAASLPTTFCDEGPASMLGSFATSGVHSLWGYNREGAADFWATLAFPGTVPAGARLQFNHSFGFEDDLFGTYDGGVIEYSVNGGGVWNDASSLVAAGAVYTGTIDCCSGNPLANRQAFVSDSRGYTATQLNLAPLAGQSFVFRFRIGTDALIDDYGWFIDDFRLYTCVPSNVLFSDGFSSGNVGAWSAAAP